MKCLTVCEPFASALVFGPKRVENRPWPTSFRGWMLIHAGKSDKWMICYPEVRRLWPGCPGLEELHARRGLVLGAVKLEHCLQLDDLHPGVVNQNDIPWASGPWCWVTTRSIAFREPFAWRGMQGLFDADVAQMPESAIEVIGGLRS